MARPQAAHFESNGFCDSFRSPHQADPLPTTPSGRRPKPAGFSAWNCAVVDFLYHASQDGREASEGQVQGRLQARRSAFWFDASSDHIPVVCDYSIGS